MIGSVPVPAEGRWSLYRLLAEPGRLRLLALISEQELGIGELAELLGESQPSVSRHVASLRSGGLVAERRRGPRCFLRLAESAVGDPVLVDAVAEGRRLCSDEGRLERIPSIVRRRAMDARGGRGPEDPEGAVPQLAPELPVYVRALSMLSGKAELALDVSAGDGKLLDVLAPFFRRVVALEHRVAKWEQASLLLSQRGYQNVELLRTELDDREVRRRIGVGADVVFARNLLTRSTSPQVMAASLSALLVPGGQLLTLEAQSGSEGSRPERSSTANGSLAERGPRLLRDVGLTQVACLELPGGFCADAHGATMHWQILYATRPVSEHS